MNDDNGKPKPFTIATLSESTTFTWGVLVSVILATSWITVVYLNTQNNRQSVESLRAIAHDLPKRQDVELIVKNAVNESLLGIYRELGEIKGRLKSVEDNQNRKGQ